MGRQVIKQPDGRFALWSTIVDDFIVLDATPEELVDFAVNEAAKKARENVEDILYHLMAGHPEQIYGQSTMTWQEACLESQRRHGRKAAITGTCR